MYYNEFKSPAVMKTGRNIISKIDTILKNRHLYFPEKILITQEYLYNLYSDSLGKNSFTAKIFVSGGIIDEAESIISQIKGTDAIILAFGGGSVLDIVKYCASKCDVPYITVPSTLSNDAIYSCVARLTTESKKKSYGVQPPIGIIIDLDVIKKSPKNLILAGVGDLVSNLSALEDWKLANNLTGEKINEMAYMLSRESVMPIFNYNRHDILSDDFLSDLSSGLITSGLAMIICGTTRPNSGAEHLISHAIDEYFPEKSTLHGIQVSWAHLLIEAKYRHNLRQYNLINKFFHDIGLIEIFDELITWRESDLDMLIPYAIKIRPRFTVLNTLS